MKLNIPATLLMAFALVACGGGGGGGDTPPAPQLNKLSLEISGTGTVQSQPAGINCPATCNAEFESSAVLTLKAIPGAGQSFSGWGGACSGAVSTCVVNMDQARAVTAIFAPSAGLSTYTFTLNIAGTGSVVSQPSGINCTANCSADFAADTVLTLTATAGNGQNFTGWSGACTGSASSCTVTMSQARTVGATFVPIVGTDFALNVSVSGNGSVVSSPAGINCGSVCSANYPAGTTVTLTATPAAGQVFSSWSGACSGALPTCVLQLTQVRAAQAVFTAAPAGSAFQTPQLLETSNDFNIGRTLVATNRSGDSIAIWEQSDGVPDGSTLKVYSRRYQAATGWQTAVVVPGLTRRESNPSVVTGQVLMDDAGVATWIRDDMETRRNTANTGWGAAFYPSNLRFSQKLTSAVMDASGNIGVLRSGSDVENNALAVGGGWGTWARVDNAGSAIAELAQVALSSNGTALAVWRESNPGDSNYSMKASRYTPAGGWGTPESIEALFTDVAKATPKVVIDNQGNGIAMWQQGNNPTVYYNIYKLGSGWQGAVEVTGEAQSLPSARIELAMTPDGRAVATWFIAGGLGTLRSMQYSPATGWTAPVTVSGSNFERKMFITDNGEAVMVYTVIDATTARFDLVSRRLSFGGQWSAATAIETTDGTVSSDAFGMNQNGQGAVIWVQSDGGSRNSLWSAVLR
jgi:Divergent InlB B-repeat domain